MSTIGDRLREERKRLGYNQEDFAAIAGVTRRPYAEWESSNTAPTAMQLALIAAAGADVRYIVTGDCDVPAPDVLSADERSLLALFRAAPLTVKAAAIGALQSGSNSQPKIRVGGKVHGQVVEGGVVNNAPVTFGTKNRIKK